MIDAQANLNVVLNARDNASKTLDSIRGSLGTLRTAIGGFGLAAAGALVQSANATQQYAEQVQKLSTLTGDSTEKTSGLIASFRSAGMGADQASSMVRMLEMHIGSFQTATGKASAAETAALAVRDQTIAKARDVAVAHHNSAQAVGVMNQAIEAANQKYDASVKAMGGHTNALQRLGVNYLDAAGKTKSMTELMPDIIDGLNRVQDSSQRAAIGQQLFGRQWTNIIPLLGPGGAGFRQAAKDADAFGLVLGETDVKHMEAFKSARERVSESLQGLQVQIGRAIMPTLTLMIDKVTAVMTVIDLWVKSHAGLIVSILKVAAVMGPLIGGVAALHGATSLLGGVLPGIGPILEKIMGPMSAILGPLGLLLAGFLLLKYAYDHLKSARDALQPAVDAMSKALAGLQGAASDLGRHATVAFGDLITVLSHLVDMIAPGVHLFLLTVLREWNDLLSAIEHRQGAFGALAVVFDQVGKAGGAVVDLIVRLGQHLETHKGIWEEFSAIVGSAWTNITKNIATGWKDIQPGFLWIQSHWPEIRDGILKIVDGALNKLSAALGWVGAHQGELASAFAKIAGGLAVFWAAAKTAEVLALATNFQALSNSIQALGSAVKSMDLAGILAGLEEGLMRTLALASLWVVIGMAVYTMLLHHADALRLVTDLLQGNLMGAFQDVGVLVRDVGRDLSGLGAQFSRLGTWVNQNRVTLEILAAVIGTILMPAIVFFTAGLIQLGAVALVNLVTSMVGAVVGVAQMAVGYAQAAIRVYWFILRLEAQLIRQAAVGASNLVVAASMGVWSAAQAVWSATTSTVIGLLDGTIIRTAAHRVEVTYDTLATDINKAAKAAWNAVTTVERDLLDGTTWRWITKKAQVVYDTIAMDANKASKGIWSAIQTAENALLDTAVGKWIAKKAQVAYDTLAMDANKLSKAAWNTVAAIEKGWLEVTTGLWLKSKLQKDWDALATWACVAAQGVWNGLQAAGAAVMDGSILGLAALKVAKMADVVWTWLCTAAQTAWDIAMDANPIGLVVLAIAALIGVIVLIITHWNNVVAAVEAVWAGLFKLNAAFGGFGALLLGLLGPIGLIIGAIVVFIAHWDAIRNAVGGFFSWLGGVIHNAIHGWDPLDSAVIKDVGGFFSGLGTTVHGGWNWVANAVGMGGGKAAPEAAKKDTSGQPPAADATPPPAAADAAYGDQAKALITQANLAYAAAAKAKTKDQADALKQQADDLMQAATTAGDTMKKMDMSDAGVKGDIIKRQSDIQGQILDFQGKSADLTAQAKAQSGPVAAALLAQATSFDAAVKKLQEAKDAIAAQQEASQQETTLYKSFADWDSKIAQARAKLKEMGGAVSDSASAGYDSTIAFYQKLIDQAGGNTAQAARGADLGIVPTADDAKTKSGATQAATDLSQLTTQAYTQGIETAQPEMTKAIVQVLQMAYRDTTLTATTVAAGTSLGNSFAGAFGTALASLSSMLVNLFVSLGAAKGEIVAGANTLGKTLGDAIAGSLNAALSGGVDATLTAQLAKLNAGLGTDVKGTGLSQVTASGSVAPAGGGGNGGGGGGAPMVAVTVNTDIQLDGKTIAKAVSRYQAQSARLQGSAFPGNAG